MIVIDFKQKEDKNLSIYPPFMKLLKNVYIFFNSLTSSVKADLASPNNIEVF